MGKEIINLIIVEDDKSTRDMYEDSIVTFNKENDQYRIACNLLEDDEKVPEILYNQRIDAIIIDLLWKHRQGKGKKDGYNLVEKIYDDCRVPIFIVSGNLNLLDKDYKESPIFKMYDRDQINNTELFDKIKELYKTGYTRALGNQSKIDKKLRDVFLDHMAETIHYWSGHDMQTQRMLRFAITRINEMLNLKSDHKEGDHTHDEYDAIEFYIKNPAKKRSEISKKPFTGDIVQYNEKEYVVMTTACDMENKKTDYVVLCGIDYEKVKEIKTKIKDENRRKSGINDLEKYVNNNVLRYHLLPPCQLFEGGLVDFQNIASVKKEDFESNYTVIVSINPVFHKDIQARSSPYYGRQGQPQLNKDAIADWIRKK